jgi:hypothetical protein
MSVGQQQHLHDLQLRKSTPVVARTKAWIHAARLLRLRVRIPPETWLSVPANIVCCQRPLCRADLSSTEILRSVLCPSVFEERLREGLGPLGLSSHEKKLRN